MKKNFYMILFALLVVFAGSIAVGAATRCDTPTPANDSWTSVKLEYDPAFLGQFGLQTTEEGLRALYDTRLQNDKAVYESCYNEKYGTGTTQPSEPEQPTQPVQPTEPATETEQPSQDNKISISEKEPCIKGKCQMPYSGVGGGYLLGVETFNNPNQSYQYEMLILDCTLLAQGKDAWIYTTGKCKVENGNALWTVWQPKYGYYWTLFRIYDKNNNLIDEACYGFQNI